MKFSIEEGLNRIAIELNDIGDYFRFDEPLSLTWAYSGGTVGKYFCLLPYSAKYREQLHHKLLEGLDRDFTGATETLYDLMMPLFSLFKNGEYTLDYYRNDDKGFFAYKTSSDNFAEFHYTPLHMIFADEVNINEIESVKKQYGDFVKENEVTKKYAQSTIFDWTTMMIYDGSDEFYATQPFNVINQERVDYWEQYITDGNRPFAIIMTAEIPEKFHQSAFYVLDGHHKLLAYQKLKIPPPLAVITYYPGGFSDNDFDFEKLSTMLYPWQVTDLLDDWDNKDAYIAEKLKNPDSPLHRFVKNGLVEEYYENKKLKHNGFYINDKPHGKVLDWYDNDQLKRESYYNMGKRTGKWVDYYPSGQLEYIQPFNDDGLYDGEMISYHKNGQVRSSKKMKDGKGVDDLHQTWFEDGQIATELRYKNGGINERKNWDEYGHLINHEIYDEEQKKLVKQPGSNYVNPKMLADILKKVPLPKEKERSGHNTPAAISHNKQFIQHISNNIVGAFYVDNVVAFVPVMPPSPHIISARL